MKALSKNDKNLLIFMSKTTMGTVSIAAGSIDETSAFKLSRLNLIKCNDSFNLFVSSQTYWSLTKLGWDVVKYV